MTTPTAISLKPEFIKKREAGWTLREIGDHYKFTYERVRQVMGDDDPSKRDGWATKRQAERDALVAEVTEWLETNGPTSRDVLLDVFDLDLRQLSTLTKHGVPSHLVLASVWERDHEFTQDDIIKAVRRVWAAVQEFKPSAEGLAVATYEEVRSMNEPSAAWVASRFGWDTICEVAGIPSGGRRRPMSSYTSGWSDPELLAWVKRYVDDAVNRGKRPTYNGYDKWQRELDDAPSGTLVRNRLRQSGIRTWSETVTTALEGTS